jgi:Cu+-exporting ATPase
MKYKLLTLSLGIVFALSYYSFVYAAHEGHDAAEAQKITAIDDTDPGKAVEVGNKTCPVSGDKIPAPGEKGTMGDHPVKVAYKGKIYNLCCPMCVKDFKKNPEKYSKMADDEVVSQKQAVVYTCPMHPEVRQATPGNCPKCGMALQPVK